MKLLAIDTSTELATVAIAVAGTIYSATHNSVRQHAQFLLPMLERLLISAQISVSELDGVVFGCGPGSFTGLRIACSIAKGIAYAHDLPVFPVNTLAAIVNEVYFDDKYQDGDMPILAMIDARMNQVYWSYTPDRVELNMSAEVSAVADINLHSVPLIIAGVGFEPYLSMLPVAITKFVVQKYMVFPQAEAMIRLVQTGKIAPISASTALPLYIRNQVTHG